MKPRLVVVGPMPPPYHGVTISTSLALANARLHDAFDVRHVDTSDDRSGENIGKWDRTNIVIATRALIGLWRVTQGKTGMVYLPLSQSRAGFVRDALLIRIAAARGWKIAAHLRGSEFRAFYERSPRLVRRWIRTTLRRITSIAVMGDSLRDIFEGIVPSQRIVVVPNGTPEPAVDGSARDGATVLFLSNLRLRKGVVEAVDAAGLVTREHGSARFLFVGEWENDQLEREMKRRASAANGRIEFRPPVTGLEKDRLLASAAVLLFPPTAPEGHPRVVLEALAAGTPVVVTDQGAIAETVVDGECGFVLPRAEPRALADMVLRLLNDGDLRVRMGEAAKRRYLDRFTQEQADRALATWLVNVGSS